jgi:hypothetical protein
MPGYIRAYSYFLGFFSELYGQGYFWYTNLIIVSVPLCLCGEFKSLALTTHHRDTEAQRISYHAQVYPHQNNEKPFFMASDSRLQRQVYGILS